MVVVVFATNEERSFRDFGRAVAAERWPQLRCKVENPAPYVSRDRTEAAAIVVHPRWTQIIDDYRAAGADVYVTDGTPPPVEIPTVEEPVVTEPPSEPPAPVVGAHPSGQPAQAPVRSGRRPRRR